MQSCQKHTPIKLVLRYTTPTTEPSCSNFTVFTNLDDILFASLIYVFTGRSDLFDITKLVGVTQDIRKPVEALRIPFVLEHFHDGFHGISKFCHSSSLRLGLKSRDVRRKHSAGTQVRIVGNDENITSGNTYKTLVCQLLPKLVIFRRLNIGDRALGHLVVPNAGTEENRP